VPAASPPIPTACIWFRWSTRRNSSCRSVIWGRNFTNRFNGTLALGLDYFDPKGFESNLVASALLALRYSFQ